jgi:hypothetical protein
LKGLDAEIQRHGALLTRAKMYLIEG